MEDLRFIPLIMFFTGALLVYGGFNDTTPLAMVRRFLGADATTTSDGTNPYTATTDPFFAGINQGGTYVAPPRSGNPGFYS